MTVLGVVSFVLGACRGDGPPSEPRTPPNSPIPEVDRPRSRSRQCPIRSPTPGHQPSRRRRRKHLAERSVVSAHAFVRRRVPHVRVSSYASCRCASRCSLPVRRRRRSPSPRRQFSPFRAIGPVEEDPMVSFRITSTSSSSAAALPWSTVSRPSENGARRRVTSGAVVRQRAGAFPSLEPSERRGAASRWRGACVSSPGSRPLAASREIREMGLLTFIPAGTRGRSHRPRDYARPSEYGTSLRRRC